MKLKEIHLKNFRCYEDLTVSLHENLTVLVAPNGQGKTAILDAISIALWDFVKKFDLAKPNPAYNIGINKDDIRIIKQGDMMARQLDVEITATNIDNFTWKRYKDSETSGSRTKEDGNARLLQKRAKELQEAIRKKNNGEELLPLFAYYGTGRLWNEKRLMEGQKKSKNDSKMRTFAYQNSLDPASNYRQFEDWFLEKSKTLLERKLLLLERAEENHQSLEPLEDAIYNIQNAIEIALQIVDWYQPRYSNEFKALILTHKKYGELKLDQLSDGIQNVFGMVADIAYRCYLLNSHLGKNAIKETEGIVLIDEVDMHLHPEWQQVILRDLQLAFPKLQFIVTTHSPQVLSTVKKENIRVIRDGLLEPVQSNTYGELSSDVMYRVQGVNPRPPIDERVDLEKLTILVDGGHYETEETKSLLNELIQKLGKHNEAIIRINRSIERQKKIAALKG